MINSSAVQNNNEACIRYLLEHGANPNLGPPSRPLDSDWKSRPTPDSGFNLDMAASKCTPEIFALLIAHGADLTHATPLHHAAGYFTLPGDHHKVNKVPMLEYLAGLGLDIDALDDDLGPSYCSSGARGTPLQHAVMWGRINEAKWLMQNGADPDKIGGWGISVRQYVDTKMNDGEFRNEVWALFNEHDRKSAQMEV